AIDEGLTELARAGKGREAEPYVRLSRAVLVAAKGNRAEALSLAAEFERLSVSNPGWATFAARIYVTLGDNNRGLDLLTRAVDAGAIPIFYKAQPLWEPIRRDARFQSMLRRMRIP